MADDESGEDDGIEDDVMPPIPAGTVVHTNFDGPPSSHERARLGLPEPSAAVAAAIEKIKTKGGSDSAEPRAGGIDPTVIAALVAKLPDFKPEWPAKTQASWFAAFEKIAGMR